MDRLLLSLLNTLSETPDPLESALGTARWWAALRRGGPALPYAAGKPRFDASLARSLRELRTALILAVDVGTGELPLLFRGDGSDAILFPLTYAACQAAAGEKLRRLRVCRSRACGRYFLDETKNGSRRWCSLRCMERARAPRRRTISR